MRHVETSPDGCWLWNGTTDRGGYGKAWFDGRMVQAHRAMFQVVAGEIPVGLHLDHLCRVRRCVNPEHLEAVTVGENTRRSTAPGVAGQHNAVKTHCPAGHLYDEANTYMYRGKRNCRACANARRRKTA